MLVLRSSKLCTKDLEIPEKTFGLNLSGTSISFDSASLVSPNNCDCDLIAASPGVSTGSFKPCSIAVVQTDTREPTDELSNPCLTVEADGNGQVGKSPLFVPFCMSEFMSEFSIASEHVLMPLQKSLNITLSRGNSRLSLLNLFVSFQHVFDTARTVNLKSTASLPYDLDEYSHAS